MKHFTFTFLTNKHKLAFIFLLIAISNFLNTPDLRAQVNEQDSLALVALYNSTDGPNWTDNAGWLTEPVTNWSGITLDTISFAEYRVIQIRLINNNLNGSFPAEMGALTQLVSLIVTNSPNLSGELPTFFSNFTLLERLELRFCNFSGTIPDFLWDLTNLRGLVLSGNAFTGNISENIGQLTNLGDLQIASNNFTGNLPVSIGDLNSLMLLYLGNNQFTGEIPTSYWNLTNLQQFSVGANPLSATIPPEVSQLTNLVTLNIASIGLTGGIPVEIGNLTNLLNLNLDNNSLSGEIPNSFSNLINLQSLGLSFNNLTGNPFHLISNMSNLSFFEIRSNNFSGQIPQSFYSLTNIQTLTISDNDFSGIISDSITAFNSLEGLNMNTNRFTQIPDLSGIENLTFLRISENNLDFGSIEPNLTKLGGAQNYTPMNPIGLPTDTLINEGDSYSITYNVGGENNLYQWYKDNQPISGATTNVLTIPNAETGSAGQYYLSVTNSLVTGLEIRSAITNVSVDINFSTTIESDSLALVDLYNATGGANWTNSQNWLSTPLNEWFGITIANGRVSSVNLNNNNLTGTIPSSIANMEALSFLDLSDNSINSPIPVEFLNLRLLTNFQINNNNLTELPNFSTMESLGNLDVKNNDLWFDDLLPLTTIANFLYSPQLKSTVFNVPTENVELPLGQQLNLNSTNQNANLNYQWHKFDWPLAGENSANFTVSTTEGKDKGFYAAGLTHPGLPGLTLFENKFDVSFLCQDFENPSLNAYEWTSYTLNGAFGVFGQNDSVTISYVGTDFNNAPIYEISDYTASWYTNFGGPANVSTRIYLECGGIRMDQRGAGFAVDRSFEGYYDVSGDSLVLTWYNAFNSFIETTVFKPKPFGGVIQQDSLALVDFYNATDGDNWNNNGNWLSTTVDRWLGVNVEGDRVSKINLPSNNLQGDLLSSFGNLRGLTEIRLQDNEIGSLPTEIGNLENLTYLGLNVNSISELPDLSNITNLQYLNVGFNYLQFEDLLPYVGLPNFNYAPQQPFGEIQEEFSSIGESITLNTSIEDNNEANYQWFLNGDSIANETGLEISINNFSTANAGLYLLQAKHPQLPQLILWSADIFLKIAGEKTNWYVDNREGTIADFRNLAQAIAATKAGDTLYIAGSSQIYFGAMVQSPRVLLGPGYFLDENIETQFNKDAAEINSMQLTATSDGTAVYGLSVGLLQLNNQSSSLSDTLQNVIIEGNKINRLILNDKHNEIDITRNFIDILEFSSTTLDNPRSYDNILINNNIIGTVQTSFDVINTNKNSLNNVLVNYNTIREVSDSINDLEFNNNIIGRQGGTNTYTNTLSFDENLFTNNSGTLSIDNDFIPNDAGLGQGAFAGDSAYTLSGLPPVPSIYTIEIGSRLSAKLNLKSNNENSISGIRYLYRRNNQSSSPFSVSGFEPATEIEVEFLPNRSAVQPNQMYDLVFQAVDETGKRSHRTYIQYETVAANLSGNVVDIDNINVTAGNVRLFAINPFANKYDTAAVQALNGSNTFNFENLILGDYIILADPNETQYPNLIPTYLGNTLDWQVADTLFLENNVSGITIQVEKEPEASTSPGSEISGFLEEEYDEADTSLRVLPRRRVSGAGVSVRTLAGSSRLNGSLRLLDDEYVLVAYTKTDENGDFSFTNLPTGDYRIRIEYPGVEVDETSDIDFNLSGQQGEEVSVEALVEDGLIKVTETGRVTANEPDKTTRFSFYPNPVKNEFNLNLENAIEANELIIFDLKGVIHRKIKVENGQTTIDIKELAAGTYIIRMQDNKGNYVMSKMIKL